MTSQKRKTGISLSISTYGILFVIFAIFLFGIFGWQTVQQLSKLEAKTKEQNLARANQEVLNTLNEVAEKTRQLANTFASWDETIQQFGNPTYYLYWQKNRVPSQGFVPTYFKLIELYNKNGVSLATDKESDFPSKMAILEPYAQIIRTDQNTSLMHFQPVLGGYKNNTVLGYLGMKIDLASAIDAVHRFKFADVRSIKINIAERQPIHLYEVNKYLSVDPLPNREFNELQSLMFSTFRSFAWIGAGLAMIYLLLQYKLLGSPARKISNHIDALRQGKIKTLLDNIDESLPVKEFEKARLSLITYQQKLDNRDAALHKNEIRMKAVLDNIVDAIIITDEHGHIKTCNPAARKIFKLDKEEAAGRDISSLIDEKSHQEYYAYFGKVFQSSIHYDMNIDPVELTAKNRHNVSFPIELIVSRMQVEDKTSFVIVIRDITERKQSQERLVYMANYDELTGLPNRALFHDRLNQAMERAKRLDKLAAVVFIDLDLFKKINDTLGHHVGDLLLIRAAERIKHCLRAMDTVARLGGDEYMAILEDINHVDEVTAVVVKILNVFDKPFVIHGNEIHITASAGIAIFPFDDTDIDELVKNADTAMFKAKDVGGNSYKYYTADMNKEIVERLNMENALRHAQKNNEFEVYYQPRIDLVTKRTTGMEALLRWRHPTFGQVSPVTFVPLLEETGLIVPVGEWVLKQACEQTRIWNQKYNQELRVSVNLSARQFLQKDLIKRFQTIISASELDPELIELEITEGLLVENVETTVKMLDEFHKMGIRISVDDFGTGYSSLSYLKKFPINTLKIDRSFIRDIAVDMDDAAIISAIITLAQNLRLQVTAEGIETEEQLIFLQNLNCHEAQGFYFSKPLPNEDFEQYISRVENKAASA